VFFAFFSRPEDIFRPTGLAEDQFFAYVTPSPLSDIFDSLNAFAENENAAKARRQPQSPRSAARSDYTSQYNEATDERPSHVFAKAKSFNHMERMIDQLISNLFIIDLVSQLNNANHLRFVNF
jgi:hypothetical protein